MKKTLQLPITAVIFVATSLNARAQGPDSTWTRSLGGPGIEVAGTNSPNSSGNNMASAAIDLVDGSTYVATYTASTTVYGQVNAGGDDILVVKLDALGDTVWTRLLGGSGTDRVYRIRAVSTGGIIAAGSTASNNGDMTGNNGGFDGFLMRISSDGALQWVQLYGGSSDDRLYDVTENLVGNFVAVGEALSVNGDLAGAGNGLAWVVFATGISGIMAFCEAPVGPNGTNPNGLENFTMVERLADGSGYLLSGFTSPNFNDPNSDDIWVCKMNFLGTVLWNRTYGSTNARDGSGALLDMGNGEFMIAGVLGGNGGYPSYRGGNGDGFVIRCDAAGDTLWTRTYGGTDWDFFHDATTDAQGHVYLAGFSRSTDQQLAGQPAFGLADYWLVKIDADGDTLYTKRMGGGGFDAATAIACSGQEDDLILAGRSDSNDGWVHGNNGQRDLWAVRLRNLSTSLPEMNAGTMVAYPNPTNGTVQISAGTNMLGAPFAVHDAQGRVAMTSTVNATPLVLDLGNLAPGMYIFRPGPLQGHTVRLFKE